MATIIPQPINKSKIKLHSLKVDMTPMVDLGFLLITFFIFTTSLAEPTITKLSMPTKDKSDMPVHEKKLLTLLLDKEKVFVYEGSWENAKEKNKIIQSSYHTQTGVGSVIRHKQQLLDRTNEKDELMVAIKPISSASYQDILNALDEMHLNEVKRYGIMQITDPEKNFLLSSKQ